MKDKKLSVYFIENLTVASWIFYIWPYFLKMNRGILQDTEIFYIDNSRMGLWVANFTLSFIKIKLQRADFRQGNMRDQDGHLIWMKTIEDSLTIREYVQKNPQFQKALGRYEKANSLSLFLGKWFMCRDLNTIDPFLVLKLIFFIRCIEQKEKMSDFSRTPERDVYFFMEMRPWFAEMKRFIESRKINVIPVKNPCFYIKIFFFRFDSLTVHVKEFVKKAFYYWMVLQFKLKRSNSVSSSDNDVRNKDGGIEKLQPRLAVEYYGYLNLDSPELFSDLFFLNRSSLSPQDILVYFGLPKVPVTEKDWTAIQKRGMAAVAINPRAVATPNVPLFNHKRANVKTGWPDGKMENNGDTLTHQWLCRHLLNYRQRYDYWVDFFTQYNVKIHVTWFKYSSDHCALIDALQNAGGVGVVYQRSFDYFLAPWTFTSADVVFGFSKWGAHIGRDKESKIPYYIVTGYLGDYRFNLLQKRSSTVRESILSHGAKRIVAYLDEHASDHPRWNISYETTLRNYSYLLNKVLENPWFGLILKPKVPSTLRSKRLGAVAELVRAAEKTGRCFIFEDSNLQSSYSPAVASLGADIVIHGHLFAATAGVESALSGVPTLFLDAEGVPKNPLYVLGEGRVIFKDVAHLWQACLDHWKHPHGTPGFGDWSAVLDELDPFRDGRAAERMGTYLQWLMEGYKAKLPRKIILADAAERYSRMWGRDKVLSVNSPDIAEAFNKNDSQLCSKR